MLGRGDSRPSGWPPPGRRAPADASRDAREVGRCGAGHFAQPRPAYPGHDAPRRHGRARIPPAIVALPVRSPGLRGRPGGRPAAMGQRAFVTATAEGRAMTLEQAIADALKETPEPQPVVPAGSTADTDNGSA